MIGLLISTTKSRLYCRFSKQVAFLPSFCTSGNRPSKTLHLLVDLPCVVTTGAGISIVLPRSRKPLDLTVANRKEITAQEEGLADIINCTSQSQNLAYCLIASHFWHNANDTAAERFAVVVCVSKKI